jgi:hypothetical protein
MDGGFVGRGLGMGGGLFGGRQMGYYGEYDRYDMMSGGYGYGPGFGGGFGGGRMGGRFGGGLGYGRMGGGFGGGFGGGRMGMGGGFSGLVGLVSGIENMAIEEGRAALDARMQMNQEVQYGYGRGQMGAGYYPGTQEYEYGREPYYPRNAEYATREPETPRDLPDNSSMRREVKAGRPGGLGGLKDVGGIQNIIPIKRVLKKVRSRVCECSSLPIADKCSSMSYI